MLDVHPPHHPADSWRDFFTHIATIVVGLLIAVALEQAVELLHHRHQVHAAREAIERETDENRKNFAIDAKGFRYTSKLLENNLEVMLYLRAHPGAAEVALPGVMAWYAGGEGSIDSAWHTAQQSGVAAYMPPEEVTHDDDLYSRLATLRQDMTAVWLAMNEAHRYALRDPNPARLSPAEVDREIDLIETALLKQYLLGIDMNNLQSAYTEFHGAPAAAELSAMYHTRSIKDHPELSAAAAATGARLAGSPH